MRDIVVGIKITAWHSMPRQIFLHMCVILSFILFKITFFIFAKNNVLPLDKLGPDKS